MIRRADAEPDPDGAAVLRASGEQAQRMWRCPHAKPKSTEPLPGPCADALERIGRVTGARGATTCPLARLREPWVHRTMQARGWREHGCLRDRYGPLTQVMAQALEAVDEGVAARERDDNARREREKKAKGHG
jgi:hypothetical protein